MTVGGLAATLLAHVNLNADVLQARGDVEQSKADALAEQSYLKEVSSQEIMQLEGRLQTVTSLAHAQVFLSLSALSFPPALGEAQYTWSISITLVLT